MGEQDHSTGRDQAEARQTTRPGPAAGAEGGAIGEGRPQQDDREPPSSLGGGVAARTGVPPWEKSGSGG